MCNTIRRGESIEDSHDDFDKLKDNGLNDEEIIQIGYLPRNLQKYPDLDKMKQIFERVNKEYDKLDAVFILKKFLES